MVDRDELQSELNVEELAFDNNPTSEQRNNRS